MAGRHLLPSLEFWIVLLLLELDVSFLCLEEWGRQLGDVGKGTTEVLSRRI